METFRNYPAHNLEGSYQAVTVISVQSPSRLYVHLADPEGSRARLLHHYAHTSVNHPEIRPLEEEECRAGAPAYFRHDEKFYRAVINMDLDEEGDIAIWLGDWALSLHARREELYTVPQEHWAVAFQAIPCGLHATRPAEGEEWRPATIDYAREYLEDRLWDFHVADKDTGADAVWINLESHGNERESLRDRLLTTHQGRWGVNPAWFDWGMDGGYHCDSVQVPLRHQRHPRPDMDPEEEEGEMEIDELGGWDDSGSDEGYSSDLSTVTNEEDHNINI